MRRTRAVWSIALALCGFPAVCGAQTPPVAVVRSVQVTEEAGVTVVTIQADGPLPVVTPRTMDGPPRVYFDLPGVVPERAGMTYARGAGVVDRARFALNSAKPLVSRVVLDLPYAQQVRLNTEERQNGRIRAFVGPGAGAALSVPSPSLAPVPAVSTVPFSAPAVVPKPVVRVSRGLAVAPLARALGRLDEQRAVLVSIEAGENVEPDRLWSANTAFIELRLLAETAAPVSLSAPARDLLMSSCTLAAVAIRLRIDGRAGDSGEARRNASSAAAGALMLFDRVCATGSCAVPAR